MALIRMAVTETDKVQIRSMYGITDELVFLSVSRLEDWKRVDRCIEIVRTLKDQFSFNKFKYIIVGGGKKREELERLVKSYQLEDHVVFYRTCGELPDKKLFCRYRFLFLYV